MWIETEGSPLVILALDECTKWNVAQSDYHLVAAISEFLTVRKLREIEVPVLCEPNLTCVYNHATSGRVIAQWISALSHEAFFEVVANFEPNNPVESSIWNPIIGAMYSIFDAAIASPKASAGLPLATFNAAQVVETFWIKGPEAQVVIHRFVAIRS